MNENDDSNRSTESRPARRRRSRQEQVLFSIAQAAKMLGQTTIGLRRTIERHAQVEGDELVARLNHGVVARRRKNLARWSVHVPSVLFG